MDGKSCLVTGAAGFIGSHLCRRLLDEGAQVHALVRPGTGLERIASIADRLVIHRADLADRNTLASCLAQAEPHIVYHLATPTRFAGNDPVANAAASVETIVEPLITLVGALADAPRPPENFVRTGTIAEYGNVALPYREERREAPVTPYGTAMLAGTHYLALLQDDLAFPSVTARLALTYGEGQSSDFLVPALFEACQRGRSIRLQRPDDRRDLIHIDDVIDALLIMGQTPLPGARHVNV
ncbi:MAG: NAD-dependent epimerase/dehydratase family protein, partial [Erythrobacter sp.]|nr:NAD-dependent epimerase/dehydratase family protein [Erythrobacter sp.]